MSTVNRSTVPNMMVVGAMLAFGNFNTYGSEFKNFYEERKTTKATEWVPELYGTGSAEEVGEGMPIPLKETGQQVVHTIEPLKYGLGVQFTAEVLDDNQYEQYWPQTMEFLKTSLADVQNIEAMFPINEGFTNVYPYGDGQPLFSPNHPTQQDNYANTFGDDQGNLVSVGLNETSYMDGTIVCENMLAASGIRTPIYADKLLVPHYLKFTAEIITNSHFMPDSAANAVNPIYTMNLAKKVLIDHYFKNPTQWVILTDCKQKPTLVVRTPIMTDAIPQEMIECITVVATQRYGFFIFNCRGLFSSKAI